MLQLLVYCTKPMWSEADVHRVPIFLSSRLNWLPPPPHPQASILSPPPLIPGGEGTLACGKGGRGSQFGRWDRLSGTLSIALSLYGSEADTTQNKTPFIQRQRGMKRKGHEGVTEGRRGQIYCTDAKGRGGGYCCHWAVEAGWGMRVPACLCTVCSQQIFSTRYPSKGTLSHTPINLTVRHLSSLFCT
jgi:hypothetical protein